MVKYEDTNRKIVEIYSKSSVPLKLNKDDISIVVTNTSENDKYYYNGIYDQSVKSYLYDNYSLGTIEIDHNNEITNIYRGATDQGYVYKNPWAFINHEDDICCISELSDATYCFKDFLHICGFEDYANEVFMTVDWQHPESYFDEFIDDEEVSVEYDNGMKKAKEKKRNDKQRDR